MVNPVTSEQYIINSNIEKNLQNALNLTEHLIVCVFLGDNHHSIRAIL